MKDKMKVHYMNLESEYFEEFIINSLIEELMDESKVIKDREFKFGTKPNYIFDAYLPSGIVGITTKETYLEIKYGNNQRIFSNIIFKNNFEKTNNKSDAYFCYIYIGRGKNIINEEYAVLGHEYIKDLAQKHPILWWNFIAQIDENARVLISNDGKKAMMYGNVLAGLDIQAVIDVSDISKLSDMNQREFMRQIKTIYPSMILGNGISIPFGSDSWPKMIDSMFDYLSPLYLDNLNSVKKVIGDSNYFTASMSKMTISPYKYNEALKLSIYRKYEDRMHNGTNLLHSVVEVKNKYLDMPLLTYNYDCFVEKDFAKFFPTVNIKTIYTATMNKKTKEPKIQHVHGFCDNTRTPHPKKIILTDEEYFKSYKGNNWVVNSQKEALEKHTCIYVGSSMSDLFQLSLIDEVKTKMNSSKDYMSTKGLWNCYALVCLKGLTGKDILTINNYYIRKSIRLIFVDDFEKLPKKLLQLFGL